MLYQKNVPLWERWLRVLGAVIVLGYGVFVASSLTLTISAFAIALFIIITGIIGFCPACALVGRRPVTPRERQV